MIIDEIGQRDFALQIAEADKVYTKVTCPVCGKKATAGMHYCGHCGSLIFPEAE